MSTEGPGGYSGYAIVEVMGHQRYVGHVEETTLAGAGMLLLTVPEIPCTETQAGVRGFTEYIPPSSLYALTPITEEEFLKSREPRELRRLTARYEPDRLDSDDDTEDDDTDDYIS